MPYNGLMDPVRMMIEIPGDTEAVRRFLLRLAPRLEARQPGVTAQIQAADLSQPLRMAMPKGEVLTVNIEPRGAHAAIKVAVQPPMRPTGSKAVPQWLSGAAGGMDRVRNAWWRWWARAMLRWALKGIRQAIAKEKLPQEG